MTTITKFLDVLAQLISAEQPADSIRNWNFRSVISHEEVDENKTMLAVLHSTGQQEVVKFNHTFRLDCHLTGTILIGEMSNMDIQDEVMKVFHATQSYFNGLSMVPIEDAILLQAVAHGVESEIDGYYMSFTIPIEIYAQF